MSKTKKTIICLLIAFASLFVVYRVALSFVGIFSLFEDPKLPQITEGEFPFIVEYEMNGERYVIEDTVICYYDGYDTSVWPAKFRTWEEELKSGEEDKRLIIELEPNIESILVDGRINIESRILLDYGMGDYYMGDIDRFSARDCPCINYVEYFQTGPKTYEYDATALSNEQLEKYFNIKIIRFEFSEPIKNEFK